MDASLHTMHAQLTTHAPSSCIGDVAPPAHFKFERALHVPSSAGIMWCQPLLFEDHPSLARKCWSTHACEGFSVFRGQHGSTWSYCLLSSSSTAGVPGLSSTSAAGEWDPQEPCNGVYELTDKRWEPPVSTGCIGDLQMPERFTFNRWRNVPGAHTTSCGTLGDMSHHDVAAMCLQQPGCRAFYIFTRSSDGQRDYCLSSAAGPLTAYLPAEWSMADTCNGVYVLQETRTSSFSEARMRRAALSLASPAVAVNAEGRNPPVRPLGGVMGARRLLTPASLPRGRAHLPRPTWKR